MGIFILVWQGMIGIARLLLMDRRVGLTKRRVFHLHLAKTKGKKKPIVFLRWVFNLHLISKSILAYASVKLESMTYADSVSVVIQASLVCTSNSTGRAVCVVCAYALRILTIDSVNICTLAQVVV